MTDPDPFLRLLGTKYEAEREDEALAILGKDPGLALKTYRGPDAKGHPFVFGSTALHYAANDGKLRLMKKLLDCGADPNASEARWYRSVLSWAANNARLEAIRLLLNRGASIHSLDALHAAAWGGSSAGRERPEDYVKTLELLIARGADLNDRRNVAKQTSLDVARLSGNQRAEEFLLSLGAA